MIQIQRRFELNDTHRAFSCWYEPQQRAYVVRTQGLTFDTRVQRPTLVLPGGPARSQLVVVLEGEYVARLGGAERTVREGEALLSSLEGWDERWEGRRFRLLALEGVARDGRLLSPQVGPVDPPTLALARSVADAIEAQAPPASGWTDWLQAGTAMGLDLVATPPATPPPEAVRLHRAINRILSQRGGSPMWVDVEEELGCTSRTLRRWIGQHQAWFNHRPDFKAQVLYWKLSSAALLLSSPENKVREVALATGYGTDRALLRAMQDHGLPPPRDIRSAFSLK